MKPFTLLILLPILLIACAGIQPNPGEKDVDNSWEKGKYAKAIKIAEKSAARGEPWAQLRMGVYYHEGNGVKIDTPTAIEWYKKVAIQHSNSAWANGREGSKGDYGFFGQNNDALIAQYQLATIYFEGLGVKQDLILSHLLINNVLDKSRGKSQVLFCCESSNGRWFTQKEFITLKNKIEDNMSYDQKTEARQAALSWNLKRDL